MFLFYICIVRPQVWHVYVRPQYWGSGYPYNRTSNLNSLSSPWKVHFLIEGVRIQSLCSRRKVRCLNFRDILYFSSPSSKGVHPNNDFQTAINVWRFNVKGNVNVVQTNIQNSLEFSEYLFPSFTITIVWLTSAILGKMRYIKCKLGLLIRTSALTILTPIKKVPGKRCTYWSL